jgi:ribosome-binding factor A
MAATRAMITGKTSGHEAWGRKALQLCRQVREALDDSLATTCRDPFLQGLTVASVEPAPNTSRLVVTLVLESGAAQPDQVAIHLHRAAGLLRCDVAAGIHRKKVPELTFRIVTPN